MWKEILLSFAIFYLIPMVICIMFAWLYNHDNPLKKSSKTAEWVFMPVMNIVCSVVIAYYVTIELSIKKLFKFIVKLLKKIDKWNKG